jgi:putative nucleotidyltransferase with HDIG domain
MDNEFVKKILSDNPKLYSLPQTLAEVLRIVKDDTSSADDLAAILMRDPALTARLLRVVNSPYYGVGRKIGSITQAVMTVGTRQVTALALCTSVYRLADNWQGSFDRVRFWRHSLEVAIGARSVAEKVGYRNLEEIFVAGLLHDIGFLVLENSFPEQFRQVWKDTAGRGSIVESEEAVWGTDHARVGQFLLEQWRLPETLCQAVGRHHHVFTPGTNNPDLIPNQIVNLADRISRFPIAHGMTSEQGPDRNNREIIRENLGIQKEQMVSVEKRLFSQTIDEAKYLEIDIGSTEDLLVEANQMLFNQYATLESLLDENHRMQRQVAGEQVKRGFLESLKSTASSFTSYMDGASAAIMTQVEQVQAGLNSGAITDPEGVVAESVRDITEKLRAAAAMTKEMKQLTQVEAALYFDQNSASALENRIKKEMVSLQDQVATT